ncbi:MAG: hypothetical protein R3358_00675 [Woeseiaceae bacterium]|nr:hypothetical protein [Woeseiaceae bacterium]
MKKSTGLLAVTLIAGGANAHPLDADTGLGEQVAHQLTAAHHLPVLLLIVVAGCLLARYLSRHSRR